MNVPGKTVARALLFSGLALALAVVVLKRFDRQQREQFQAQQKIEKSRYFSALCGDISTYNRLLFSESNNEVVLQKKDRWRTASSRPVEGPALLVRLAHLRGLKVEELRSVDDLAGLGLKAPVQRLDLFGTAAPCSVSLGLKHPSDDRYALMRQSGQQRRIGWAKLKPQGEGLIGLKALRVRSPLPFSAGQIEALEFLPQVGAKRFEIRRKRGAFELSSASADQRADGPKTEALFSALVGLRGEWVETPPPLVDADLSLLIVHPPGRSRADFFLAEDRVYLRLGSSVFLLDTNPLPKLMVGADALRDLQVVRYDRSALASLALHDGTGRVFSYRREPAKQGVDRWFEGDRTIEAGHRLAAMQWDLHTLRAESIVDELSDLSCAKNCRRVVVTGADGLRSVDLRLERHEGAYLLRLGQGPVMRADGKQIDLWPFEGVR